MSFVFDEQETIDHIAVTCGDAEAEKGFREDYELALELEQIAMLDDLTQSETDTLNKAAKALRNYYVGTKLMLIVSEIAEGMESLRNTGVDGHVNGDGNLGEELADAHIRLFALEQLLGVKPGTEVMAKIDKNSGRAYKHGRSM